MKFYKNRSFRYQLRHAALTLAAVFVCAGATAAETTATNIPMPDKAMRGKTSASGNLLPDSSFESGGAGQWNRMKDHSYLQGCPGWSTDQTTAFHGRKSLVGIGKNPLILQGEGYHGDGFFSIYLKSAPPHGKVRIEVFSYRGFAPFQLAAEDFETSGDWRRCILKIKRTWLRFEAGSAPFFIRITPLSKGKIWADAVQLERGALTSWQEYRPVLRTRAIAEKLLRERLQALPQTDLGTGRAGTFSGTCRFTVQYPRQATGVPVTVGIPFAPGKCFMTGNAAVQDENGKIYPAQATVTARWPGDGSIRSAAVDFEGDLQAGHTGFQLIPGTGTAPGRVFRREAPEFRIFMEDTAGNFYEGKEIIRESEGDGAVFSRELRRGIFCDSAGSSPGEYTLRIKTFHSNGATVIDAAVFNSSDMPLAIRNAGLRIISGRQGEAAVYSQTYAPETRCFAMPPDISCGAVSGNAGTLIFREASLRHPALLELDRKGDFTAWIWPKSLKALILSRKMSINREFVYLPPSVKEARERFGDRATALADPDEFIRSGFFIIPIGRVDKKLPLAEKILTSIKKRFPKGEALLKNQVKVLHGVFNYGDVYGDGGWGNLESFLDFSEMIYAVGTNDLDSWAAALERARHYRDVDIIDGSACYHSSNHSGGVRYDFSHSWPQGIIIHYLMTGDPRSREVCLELANRYRERQADDAYIQESRSLARYLLGLADFYAMTGSPGLRQRFMDQLEHVEKRKLKPAEKDQTIFHWHGRLDPYQVWYGACAMMEMYKLTGDARLLNSFRREMDASLNMDFYRHDLQELWPGLPPETAWPIQLGYHSGHRGALMYPLMRFYAETFGKPEMLRLAGTAAYAEFLRGYYYRMPMDIFRMAAITPEHGAEYLEAALSLRRRAAAKTLLNGDFSKNPGWFSNWHLPAGRQMSYDDIVNSWPLTEKKEFPRLIHEYRAREKSVSPWRGYSRNFGYLDPKNYFSAPPSLRITLSRRWSYGQQTSLETAEILVHPGQWKLSGFFRSEPGLENLFIWNFTPEKGLMTFHRFRPKSQNGRIPVEIVHAPSTLKDYSAELSQTSKPGWRKFEFRFTVPAVGIASARFQSSLTEKTTQANIWFDDIKLERIK